MDCGALFGALLRDYDPPSPFILLQLEAHAPRGLERKGWLTLMT